MNKLEFVLSHWIEMCHTLPVAQFYVADLSYPCWAGCDCQMIAVALHLHSPE